MQQQCTTALKNAKKIPKNQKIEFKKKSDFFRFFLLKIMIFSNPVTR